jgi:uncharacterized membrane protein YGL010W
MKSFDEQVVSYAAYHGDWRNKASHFVGVPLIIYALFVFMGWLRFAPYPGLPITGATVFYAVVFVYYLRLDKAVALSQMPFSVALLWLADKTSLLPFMESFLWFLGTFVGGWIIQLIGHKFEGKRPALVDNLMQIFNAPLFLSIEVFFMLGLRRELRAKIQP